MPNNIIISYPRCGLTWARTSLYVYNRLFNGKEIADVQPKRNGIAEFEHEGMGLKRTTEKDVRILTSRENNPWNDYNVLFLVRDPRDVINSNFSVLTIRGANFPKFFVMANIGFESILKWWAWWSEHKDQCISFKRLFFEDRKKNPVGTLRTMLEFFGVEIDDNLVDLTVKKTSLNRVDSFRPKDVSIVNTSDGLTGNWRCWRLKEQIDAYNLMKKYNKIKFLKRYLKHKPK